jgi:hypothetical protein
MEDEKDEDRIRRRAYELWERQGSPEGRAEEFWEEAKFTLAEKAKDVAGESSPAEPTAHAERPGR